MLHTPDGKVAQLANHTSCPDCNCKEINQVNFGSQHCNGTWNETIQFGCGAKYVYSPNFRNITQTSVCTRNAAYDAQKQIDEQYRQKILSMISRKKDISKAAKLAFTTAIKDVYIHYWKLGD